MAIMRGEDSFGDTLFPGLVGEPKDLDAVDVNDGSGRTFRQIVKANDGRVIDVVTDEVIYDSADDEGDD